ncbi:hypothetical protein X798_01149, partial [Onchocerca flexuosa]
MRDSRSNSFLVKLSCRSISLLDSIPTLLDLNRKDTLTVSAIVCNDNISSYISQDVNPIVCVTEQCFDEGEN